MYVKYKKINEILKKAEEYRKDLSKGYSNETKYNSNEKDLGEIFKEFFGKN
jgi:hypothetical protein